MPMLLLIKRLCLVVAAVFAVATSLSYRLGKVGPDDFIDNRRPVADIEPTDWKKLDSDDWFRLAENNDQLDKKREYALNALATDLTSGKAAVRFANVLLQTGSANQAEQVGDLAARLATAQNNTQVQLATLWSKLAKENKLIETWNILLTRDQELRKSLFPHLRKLIFTPGKEHLFDKFATTESQWWPSFFIFLAQDKQTPLPVLARLYNLPNTAKQAPTENENKAYISRLIEEKQWQDARNVWLKSLPTELSSYQGLVFDGGFEGDQVNSGFNWYLTSNKQVKIQQELTFGMEGHHALHINFIGSPRFNFQNIWQRLVLEPGHYELGFRYRAERFRTTKGLQWRIICIDDNKLLAESPAILANPTWKPLQIEFDVPSNCPVQYLRLEATSRYAHEQVFSGDLWLDAVRINKK